MTFGVVVIGLISLGSAVEVCWGDVWTGGDCFGESRFGCQGTVGMDPAGSGKAVQVRTGKVLRVLIRPGWVGHGKAVQVGIVMEWFGRVGTGSAV